MPSMRQLVKVVNLLHVTLIRLTLKWIRLSSSPLTFFWWQLWGCIDDLRHSLGDRTNPVEFISINIYKILLIGSSSDRIRSAKHPRVRFDHSDFPKRDFVRKSNFRKVCPAKNRFQRNKKWGRRNWRGKFFGCCKNAKSAFITFYLGKGWIAVVAQR